LSYKKDIVSVDDVHCFDFGALMLLGLADTVFNVVSVFGSKSVRIEMDDGSVATIESPDEDPDVLFGDRIEDLVCGAMMVAKQSGVCYDSVIGLLLVQDGWFWNDEIFRTPIWMNDYREIPVCDARRISGLGCLEGSSLEIK